MSRINNPCNGVCPDRSPACHGHCERYAEYAGKMRAMNEERGKNSVWTRAKLVAHRKEMERKKKYVMGYFK